MAVKKGYDELVGRAVTDGDFRKKLMSDPEVTIAEEGYEVSEDVIAKLKAIDPEAAEAAAKDIDDKFGAGKAAT